MIVSPTLPVGPGDVNLTPPSRMLLGFLNGEMPAYLQSTLNIVDVRDLADAHLAAADRGEPGRRYVIGNETVQLSELLRVLGEVSGVKMPRWRVPYPLAWAVAACSEAWATCVTRRPPLATVTGVRLTRMPVSEDVATAPRELGLTLRPLRASLADAVQWFAKQGLIELPPPRQRGEDLRFEA
jgi:dihydroflavonol-4-reductase